MVAVMVYGELSAGALIAVGTTGVVLASVGLVRRAGEAASPLSGRGLPWLLWLAAAAAWEVITLVGDELRTLSDLLDPLLARPVPRGLATIGWLAGGAWLLVRPRHRDESR